MENSSYEIVKLPRVADPRGNLSFVQGGGALPFEIERCYWVYDVPSGRMRNGRALRSTSEMIVALSGAFDVVVDTGGSRSTVHLCRGDSGLLLAPMCWREISNFSTNAVAMVLADKVYDPADYIFDHDAFLSLVNN